MRTSYYYDEKNKHIIAAQIDDGELVSIYPLQPVELEFEYENDAEPEEPAPPARKGKRRTEGTGKRAVRACRNCGQPGHNSKTCPQGGGSDEIRPIRDDQIRKEAAALPDFEGEAETVERIRDLWVGTDANSQEVCAELGLSMGMFNKLLVKHKIKK